MRQKLFNLNNRILKIIFYLFFTATFIFALTSSNLILGDNHITNVGTSIFTTVFLIVVASIGILTYVNSHVRHFWKWLFITNRWITSICCFILVIILQIIYVTLTHDGIGSDVLAVHQALTNTKDVNLIGYFSVNPNNLGLLLFQHWLATVFHSTTWKFFDFVTVFFIDLSAILNLFSIATIDKNKVPTGLYIQSLWLATFANVIVPYTDNWVTPLVSLYILCYCIMAHSNLPKPFKFIAALVFGISLSASYFMKPSGIIPAIAIVIISIIDLLKKQKRQWWWLILLSLIVIGSTTTAYYEMNHYIKNQTYIRSNSFRAKPMVHFINMGMTGKGGYDAKESFKMVILINKQDRIDYSVKSIKKHLAKMGPVGYASFLFHKHGANTSDGAWGWLREGDLVPMHHMPAKHGMRNRIENFTYLYGNNVGDFRFIVQIWWCIWLGIILFAFRDDQTIVRVMRLSLIGAFIFLLIFEGGRTRYLIQFVPAFILLGTFGLEPTTKEIKRVFSWTKLKNQLNK